MEHAQRSVENDTTDDNKCLNPYFNGTCSKIVVSVWTKDAHMLSLNPYFNGTCSKIFIVAKSIVKPRHRLNPYFNGTCSKIQDI